MAIQRSTETGRADHCKSGTGSARLQNQLVRNAKALQGSGQLQSAVVKAIRNTRTSHLIRRTPARCPLTHHNGDLTTCHAIQCTRQLRNVARSASIAPRGNKVSARNLNKTIVRGEKWLAIGLRAEGGAVESHNPVAGLPLG